MFDFDSIAHHKLLPVYSGKQAAVNAPLPWGFGVAGKCPNWDAYVLAPTPIAWMIRKIEQWQVAAVMKSMYGRDLSFKSRPQPRGWLKAGTR